ncbi:hypothetical protein LguiA_034653 [Lonicera macranthoides]
MTIPFICWHFLLEGCYLIGRHSRRSSVSSSSSVTTFNFFSRVCHFPYLSFISYNQNIVLKVFLFNHEIYRGRSTVLLLLAIGLVNDIIQSLKGRGCDLMIRFGNAEIVIQELVKEVKATTVFAEEEVEYNLRRLMNVVQETLAMVAFEDQSPRILLWNTPFYDTKNFKDLPESYHDFKKLKLPISPPLLPPKLPDLEVDLAWGPLPTLDDLKEFMNDSLGKSKDKWTSMKNTSPEDIMQKDQIKIRNNLIQDLGLSKLAGSRQINLDDIVSQNKRSEGTVFLTQEGNSVRRGTSAALNALAAYLRYLEGTTRYEWQEVHEKLRNAESREGASFGALFGSALHLGTISRRRVHYEAIKYEKERNGGFLSPFGYSAASIAAAADTVCSMEWYWLLASRSQKIDDGKFSIRIWRWKGYVVQYTVAGHKGPAILLVHGFGAFLEHYRDNIKGMAEEGNRVWAITLLGFGKSEKPNVVYTEILWAELLRDFIIEVVGEPVHLAGNSIGGYFVAITAGLWPSLVKSVVLLNSAGNVVPGYSPMPLPQERRNSWAARLGARLLEFYLRLGIKNIVKSYYPNKKHRADDWLINEMLRASYDPGVVVVLESIFGLNLSIPLNYLLKGFEDKVIVIQGMKDPLSDSKSNLAKLREQCKGIVIRELDAGHCPHDELPEVVNSIIREWVVAIERGK